MKLLHLTELFFNDFIFYSVKKQFEYLKMMLQRKNLSFITDRNLSFDIENL